MPVENDIRQSDLFRFAAEVRQYLETVWPSWHAIRGRPIPVPSSCGTCQTSSLFLTESLSRAGFNARVAQGNDPDKQEGFSNQGRWRGHAWVVCAGFILDITADQFGGPPVVVEPLDHGSYREGDRDTATHEAKRVRSILVDSALLNWKLPDHR